MPEDPIIPTTDRPFEGGVIYIHPDDVPLIDPAILARAAKVDTNSDGSASGRLAPDVQTDQLHLSRDEAAAYSLTAPYDVYSHEDERLEAPTPARTVPVTEDRYARHFPTQSIQISQRTSRLEVCIASEKMKHVLDRQRQSVSCPTPTCCRSSEGLSKRSLSFSDVKEGEPVAQEEKNVLAKLELCYADMWMPSLDGPPYQRHTPFMGFARLLNRIFRHCNNECETMALSPSTGSAGMPRLCVTRRSATPVQAFASGEVYRDNIFTVELAPLAISDGENDEQVVKQLEECFLLHRDVSIQRSQDGDDLVWHIGDSMGTLSELSTPNQLHKALLQAFLAAREAGTSWTSVLVGSRAIICRLDNTNTMSVVPSTLPISTALTHVSVNLPAIIIALALDRSLHPARGADVASADEQIEERMKSETDTGEPLRKRQKIDPGRSGSEPGLPSGCKVPRRHALTLAATIDHVNETPTESQPREMLTVHLESSSHWLPNQPTGPLKLEVTISDTMSAEGRYYDVFEGTIAVPDANRILDADFATEVGSVSSSAATSTAKGTIKVDPGPDGHNKRLPIVAKLCAPERMYHRWEAGWYQLPVTEEECTTRAMKAVLTETGLYTGKLRSLQGRLVPRFLGLWIVKSGLERWCHPDLELFAIVLERLGDQVLDDDLKGDKGYFDARKAQMAESLNLLHVQGGITHGDLSARQFRSRYRLKADDPPNLAAWPPLPRHSIFLPPMDIRVIDCDRATEADEEAQMEEAVEFCGLLDLPTGWGTRWRRQA